MKHILGVNHSLPNFLCDSFSLFMLYPHLFFTLAGYKNLQCFSFLFYYSCHPLIVVVLILPVFMLFIFFAPVLLNHNLSIVCTTK